MGSRRRESEEETQTSSCSIMDHLNMSSSSSSRRSRAAASQYSADARLLLEFEQSTKYQHHHHDSSSSSCCKKNSSFNYKQQSVNYSSSQSPKPEPVPELEITAYLSKIQRGGLIQSFGFLLCIEEPSFRILAYSLNSFEMLDLHQSYSLLGIDARTLFTHLSATSLTKAASSPDISLSNPVLLHSAITQTPFYAILHRIDVGTIIDLEPIQSGDPWFSIAGAMQSQKLAVQAISRLQSLPGSNISVLCDTLVEEVQELTGYDRVMVYKFHEDEHGEVVSEIRRSDLEPYLGLHYPATDIPQATRFLFKQSRVRMICDCHANAVSILQSENLNQPLCLVNSTLRSPHDCHRKYMANMGSAASLVMAIVLSRNDSTNLWGLVACHHCSPRYVPFPVRYACEFLVQAFGLQLNIELQLGSHLEEKKIMKTQALLCDMLLRDIPFGIVTQSPNIMDLVNCDGAAFYYGGMCRLLGVTPTELQIKDIVDWLLICDRESTVLSTESLVDVGYPRAATLTDVVCGMATARITSKAFLFWFRSHAAKEVKWGGARHHPDDKDDGGRMHPRSSFKAFTEVVKNRSLPWGISDMNAIHSLQIIMRGSFQDIEVEAELMLATQQTDSEMEKLVLVTNEMVRLIETAAAPIFGVDTAGHINRWNAKTAELTGLPATEAMGKNLARELVHEESRAVVEYHLSQALQGEEGKNIELRLRTSQWKHQNGSVFIVANACTSKDHTNGVVGVCFVGQDVTEEKSVMDKFTRLQGDYKAIIHSLNPLIPPIFASDENAHCSEWNAAMEKLTGFSRCDVIGKMLPGEIFGSFCRLKDQDAATKFMILLYHTLCDQNTEKAPFAFFDKDGMYVEALLTAIKRTDINGNVIGCFCFLQTVVPVLQQVLDVRTQNESRSLSRLKSLAYIRQEMQNPLNGIQFANELLRSIVSDEQRHFLEISESCERHIMKIIGDTDYGGIEDGSMKLNMERFSLKSLLDATVSQVMILVREKKLHLIHDIVEEIKILSLYGDQIRLQQVLSNFLWQIVHHAPSPDGWVEIRVTQGFNPNEDETEIVQLQFRMTHPGHGPPSELVQDILQGGTQWVTQEALRLSSSRKLLEMMNGRVKYVTQDSKSYFLIDIGLQNSEKKCKVAEADMDMD